jgi:membrane protease YdiL (CAAX protease family)
MENFNSYDGEEKYNPYMITSVTDLTEEEAKKEIRKCSTRNSCILLLLFLFLNITSIVASSTGLKNTDMEMLMYLLNYAVAFPLCLLIANHGKKNTVKTYFQKPQITKKQWFEWACVGYFLTQCVNIAGTYIFGFIDSIVQKSGGDSLNAVTVLPDMKISVLYAIVYFLAVGICAPVFEEMLLRGSCMTGTLKYGQWFSFAVIGISFGILHGNFQQMFYASAIGILLGFIAFKSKSIIPAIATHMLLNIPSAINGLLLIKILGIMKDAGTKFDITLEDLEDSEKLAEKLESISFSELADYFMGANLVYFILLAIMMLVIFTFFLIGLILFIKKFRNRKEEFFCGNVCTVINNKQKVLAYLSSPATIIFIILILSNAILTAIF